MLRKKSPRIFHSFYLDRGYAKCNLHRLDVVVIIQPVGRCDKLVPVRVPGDQHYPPGPFVRADVGAVVVVPKVNVTVVAGGDEVVLPRADGYGRHSVPIKVSTCIVHSLQWGFKE